LANNFLQMHLFPIVSMQKMINFLRGHRVQTEHVLESLRMLIRKKGYLKELAHIKIFFKTGFHTLNRILPSYTLVTKGITKMSLVYLKCCLHRRENADKIINYEVVTYEEKCITQAKNAPLLLGKAFNLQILQIPVGSANYGLDPIRIRGRIQSESEAGSGLYDIIFF
jgi:hypothetical protein